MSETAPLPTYSRRQVLFPWKINPGNQRQPSNENAPILDPRQKLELQTWGINEVAGQIQDGPRLAECIEALWLFPPQMMKNYAAGGVDLRQGEYLELDDGRKAGGRFLYNERRIEVYNQPISAIKPIMTHEIGHALDIELAFFANISSERAYYPTDYSRTNAAEHFAEVFTALVLNPGELLSMIDAKKNERVLGTQQKQQMIHGLACMELIKYQSKGYIGQSYWNQRLNQSFSPRYWLDAKADNIGHVPNELGLVNTGTDDLMFVSKYLNLGLKGGEEASGFSIKQEGRLYSIFTGTDENALVGRLLKGQSLRIVDSDLVERWLYIEQSTACGPVLKEIIIDDKNPSISFDAGLNQIANISPIMGLALLPAYAETFLNFNMSRRAFMHGAIIASLVGLFLTQTGCNFLTNDPNAPLTDQELIQLQNKFSIEFSEKTELRVYNPNSIPAQTIVAGAPETESSPQILNPGFYVAGMIDGCGPSDDKRHTLKDQMNVPIVIGGESMLISGRIIANTIPDRDFPDYIEIDGITYTLQVDTTSEVPIISYIDGSGNTISVRDIAVTPRFDVQNQTERFEENRLNLINDLTNYRDHLTNLVKAIESSPSIDTNDEVIGIGTQNLTGSGTEYGISFFSNDRHLVADNTQTETIKANMGNLVNKHTIVVMKRPDGTEYSIILVDLHTPNVHVSNTFANALTPLTVNFGD
jgi:hypothetical protein